MSFPRYAEYKDSGVEWLGEVPSSWEVTKTKFICDFFTGWTPPTGNAESFEGNNLWANISDLGEKVLHDTAKRVSDMAVIKSDIQVSPKGSLLFSFKLSIGQVSFCGKDLYTNEAIATFIESNHLDLLFAYYAFPIFLIQNASTNIYGAKLLNQDLMRNAKFAIPNKAEQTQIAAFLDHETAKIDNLINQQKKLIELLKEKRQAVISHAVTKGLNPNAPMKDSGVEWLGKVPEGWEVKPIKKLGHIVSGYAFPSSDFVKEGEIRVLKISNIQTGYLDWSDESYLPKSSYIDNFSIKNGDIIFALTRPIISTGIKAAVATIAEGEIVLLNQRNALFRPFPIAERKFLYYILFDYNFKAAFENCIDSTGQQPNISPIDIGNIFVAVPPINEQTTIVAFLDQETAKIDNLIQKAQKAIQLLQERRTALISAAVTGKIDVRGFVKT